MCVVRYVECGGSAALLDSMTLLASMERSSATISDAVLQLDCLCCLRTLLGRRDGLKMFLDAKDNVTKLVECQSPIVPFFMHYDGHWTVKIIIIIIIIITRGKALDRVHNSRRLLDRLNMFLHFVTCDLPLTF